MHISILLPIPVKSDNEYDVEVIHLSGFINVLLGHPPHPPALGYISEIGMNRPVISNSDSNTLNYFIAELGTHLVIYKKLNLLDT